MVLIKGSTGVMAAWGFHYYLTQHCHCHISWDYDQLNLPTRLPEISIRIASYDEWDRSMREINLPLDTQGHFYSAFAGFDTIRTCAPSATVRRGGSGPVGREKSTGWP